MTLRIDEKFEAALADAEGVSREAVQHRAQSSGQHRPDARKVGGLLKRLGGA